MQQTKKITETTESTILLHFIEVLGILPDHFNLGLTGE